jgi:crossover junction endodeoxyribonuclease RusA
VIIFVIGEPKGQPRPRAFVNKATGRASVYDAGTAEHWKSQIAEAARSHLPSEPFDCPIGLTVDFHMPRPKRLMRKKDPDDPIRHTAKPDLDNLTKAVMDALTAIGMWRDDSQVCHVLASKWYAAKDRRPGATITVSTAPSGR